MTFLEQFLAHYSKNQSENDVIIFPNNRPILEFRNLFQQTASKNSWFPEIITLSDVLSREMPANAPVFLDKVLALSEALSIALNRKNSELNNYDFVVKLIEDFEEVQREKINPVDIFSKVSYIKLLEKWELDAGQLGVLGKSNLLFWEKLVDIFLKYQENLERLNLQTQPQLLGKINELSAFKNLAKSTSKFWFVGFNNFNASELHFIDELGKNNAVESVFDVDNYYLKNDLDVAGKFLRKSSQKIEFKKTFLHAEWQSQIQQFSHTVSDGNIAMLTAVFEELKRVGDQQKTAVVFLDQSLLQTAIFSLPQELRKVNVGAGIQLQYSLGYSLILNFLDGNFPGLFEVLNQLALSNIKSLQKTLKERPKSATIWSEFVALNSFLSQLKFDNSNSLKNQFSASVISASINLLNRYANEQEKFQKIPEEFIKKSFLNELKTSTIDSISERSSNIQFLGLLETRNIDVDYVIMVSFNDAVFPGNIISNSIIPNDVRNRFGLQMPNDSEGLLAYYFYQSIQRAKKISLLSVQSDAGFTSSEPSRYLKQLRNSFPGFEKNFSQHKTEFSEYEESANGSIVIPQNEKIKAKIINYLSQRGCSVSALNLLIRNPLDFYNQYVLGLKEPTAAINEVSHAELGTLFHNIVEDVYKPFVGSKLVLDTFKQIEKSRKAVFEKRIKELEVKLTPTKGVLDLYKNICLVWLDKFLAYDESRIKSGRDITLKELEQRCEIDFSILVNEQPTTIKLVGSIDRVEEENGVIRLIDYKTGKVEQKDLRLDDISDALENPAFSKSNQLLFYSLLYSRLNKCVKIESAIYSCRNNLSGILPLTIQKNTLLTNEDFLSYEQALKMKLASMLTSDFEFVESNEFSSKFNDLMV
ncbi:MAG: hypothetical protein CL842_08460 [Crocinitomicaceae bacterium]|nr:hypothetical protein [Crocinitomicaceae bacterium]